MSTQVFFRFKSKNDNYKNRDIKVIIDDDNTTWWVAKDVCNALWYCSPGAIVGRFCKEEPKYFPIQTGGGLQRMRIISNADLDQILTHSRSDIAADLKQWIEKKALPTIEKIKKQKRPKVLHNIYQIPCYDDDIKTDGADEIDEIDEAAKTAKPHKPCEPCQTSINSTSTSTSTNSTNNNATKTTDATSLIPVEAEFRAAMGIAELIGIERSQAILSANRLTKQITGISPLRLFSTRHSMTDFQRYQAVDTRNVPRVCGLRSMHDSQDEFDEFDEVDELEAAEELKAIEAMEELGELQSPF